MRKGLWIGLGALCVLLLGAKIHRDNTIRVGDGNNTDKELIFDVGAASDDNPRLKWDSATSKLQFTNDNTNIFDIGSGSGSGGGGTNIVDNAGAENGTSNWTNTGSGSFTTSTVAAEVALGGQSFEWNADAASDTLESDAVSVDDYKIIKNRLCLMSFWYLGGDANITAQVWDGAEVITSIALEAAAEYTASGDITFVCPSTGTLAVRFLASADAATIHVDDVFLGTRTPQNGTVQTDWVNFTPILTNVPTTEIEGAWRRDGPDMLVKVQGLVSGAVTGTIGLTVPDGKSVIGELLGTSSTVKYIHGEAFGRDVSVPSNNHQGVVVFTDATTIGIRSDDITSWGASEPFVWASNDRITLNIRIPITEWAGTSLVFQPTVDDLPFTNWKSYSPVFVNDTAHAPSTSTFLWRRDGADMLIEFAYSPSANGTDGGDWTFSIPPGHTIINPTEPNRFGGVSYLIEAPGGDTYGEGTIRKATDTTLKIIFGRPVDDLVGDVSGNEIGTSVNNLIRGINSNGAIRIPIVEFANAPSLPPIGVEVASDGKPGLQDIEDSGELDLPALSWNGTPPSSLTYGKYRWWRDGDQVTVVWRARYGVSGSGNLSANWALPGSMPTPLVFSVTSTSQYLSYHGSGALQTSISSGGTTGVTKMFYPSANNFNVYIVVNSSTAAQAIGGTLTYTTAD